mmetsp:Transcript_4090/g.5991  ORF Transcript_4090/g.5991 Transcript_4090/m.5991 type:complete len:221 (-) Transcript_4090:125-787(-)
MSAPLPPKDSFVPPIITTTTTSKSSTSDDNSRDFVEFTASIDDILQGHANAKQHTTTSAYAVDDSITEDTLSIDYDTELEYSIADDDDDDDIDASSSSTSSSNSSSPNKDEDSTRRVLKQAHQRLKHQSIYEEVKLLRTQLCQTLEIVNKCNNLEQQLSKANQTIERLQMNEKRYKEELAKCEMDFVNKLNDMCEMMEVEILKRDERIVELQNRLNERRS